MNRKFILFGLVLGFLVLSGCTSETPRGDISAPTSGPISNTVSPPSDTPPVKESYKIGEKAVTKDGLEVTLTELVWIPKCDFDSTDCVAGYVKAKNSGEEKTDASFFGSSVVLDDKGNQSEHTTINCPKAFDSTALFPGAIREGFICFKDVLKESQLYKIVLNVGFFDQTNFIYLVKSDDISIAVPSAEVSFEDVDAKWVTGFYASGTINSIDLKIKNTGDTILSDLSISYEVTKTGHPKITGEDKIISTVDADEEKIVSALVLDSSLGQKGEYAIKIVLYEGDVELGTAGGTFTV